LEIDVYKRTVCIFFVFSFERFGLVFLLGVVGFVLLGGVAKVEASEYICLERIIFV